MHDPIQHLLSEHEEIREEIARLRRAVRDLEARGELAVPAVRPVLEAVARMMRSQLATHARKEDEGLFPALEEVLGAVGTPTAVMRAEHQDIHAQAELFRRTLHELNEVEHPAIVARGAELGDLARGAGAERLRATGEEILRLLDLHFEKEEKVLFPMARQVLSSAALRQVALRMEEIEAAPRGE